MHNAYTIWNVAKNSDDLIHILRKTYEKVTIFKKIVIFVSCVKLYVLFYVLLNFARSFFSFEKQN